MEDYDDRPRKAYARLVANDDAPAARPPSFDYDTQDEADEPLDTLDVRDHTEVDRIEEALEDLRRKFAGSWVMGALAELIGVGVNLCRIPFQVAALARGQTANPVVRTAEQQDTVDEVAEERIVARTRTAAQQVQDVRRIAKMIARGDKVDSDLLHRVDQDKGCWLLALTTGEADRLASADLKDIDLHSHNVPVVAGVRTPAQYEQGIAAVIAATSTKPPRLNAEIYRELQAKRRGPSMEVA